MVVFSRYRFPDRLHPEARMSAPSSPKQRILDAVQRLPADASFEDVMERLYFLYKVDRGLADADAGRVIPHEEVKRQFGR